MHTDGNKLCFWGTEKNALLFPSFLAPWRASSLFFPFSLGMSHLTTWFFFILVRRKHSFSLPFPRNVDLHCFPVYIGSLSRNYTVLFKTWSFFREVESWLTLGKKRKEVSRLCHAKVKDREQKFSFPRSSVAQKFASASAKTFFERRSREDFAQKRPEPFFWKVFLFMRSWDGKGDTSKFRPKKNRLRHRSKNIAIRIPFSPILRRPRLPPPPSPERSLFPEHSHHFLFPHFPTFVLTSRKARGVG